MWVRCSGWSRYGDRNSGFSPVCCKDKLECGLPPRTGRSRDHPRSRWKKPRPNNQPLDWTCARLRRISDQKWPHDQESATRFLERTLLQKATQSKSKPNQGSLLHFLPCKYLRHLGSWSRAPAKCWPSCTWQAWIFRSVKECGQNTTKSIFFWTGTLAPAEHTSLKIDIVPVLVFRFGRAYFQGLR